MSAPDVFISVAEASADAHAAALLRETRCASPEIRFFGLTGPSVRALGAETIADLTAYAAMLSGAIGIVGRAWQALSAAVAAWERRRPDLVLLLDSPELNLKLASRARSRGIPVLYYIAPQTWASRSYRNRTIARDVDHLACILPFEEAYFRSAGVRATFVGHPLFETLRREVVDPQVVSQLRSAARPLIVLLPGSRSHVIQAVLPLQLAALQRLPGGAASVSIAVSAADESRVPLIEGVLQRAAVSAVVRCGQNASLLSAADLVLVASGTATLHVAHYRKPMVVLYDAGRWMGHLYRALGRYIVHTPHLSLINILGARRIVPEFMPTVPDPLIVARVIDQLLSDEAWRRVMIESIDEVVAPLESGAASRNVYALMLELLNRR